MENYSKTFLLAVFFKQFLTGTLPYHQGQIELPLGPGAANHSGPLSINS